MPDAERKADLVLEGGGVKGIGLLGAVLVLAEAGYSFPRVAGTSAGAIVASLVSAYQKAGRDLRELVGVMNSVQYSRFADGPPLGRMAGRLGEGVELLLHEGAHPGNYLVEWLGAELEKAGVSTFADLAIDDPGGSLGEHQRYSLVVHTSDLSRRALVRLPWDYGQYGKPADGERVSIKSGLVPGDRVVVDGTDRLRDGAKINIAGSAKPARGTEDKSKNAATNP